MFGVDVVELLGRFAWWRSVGAVRFPRLELASLRFAALLKAPSGL